MANLSPDSDRPGPLRRVCVFAGSGSGRRSTYGEITERLATLLVQRGIGIVYGGGRVGLMQILADTVLSLGGEIIGVMPGSVIARGSAYSGLTDLHAVPSLLDGYARMRELSDAFIGLPGGIGTLAEILSVLSGAQLRLHRKPAGLLNIEAYWAPLITFFRQAEERGFVKESDWKLLILEETPEALLGRLEEEVTV
jgi:uncharacterized protein (TIGR00730 family)